MLTGSTGALVGGCARHKPKWGVPRACLQAFDRRLSAVQPSAAASRSMSEGATRTTSTRRLLGACRRQEPVSVAGSAVLSLWRWTRIVRQRAVAASGGRRSLRGSIRTASLCPRPRPWTGSSASAAATDPFVVPVSTVANRSGMEVPDTCLRADQEVGGRRGPANSPLRGVAAPPVVDQSAEPFSCRSGSIRPAGTPSRRCAPATARTPCSAARSNPSTRPRRRW